jgi:hypothetical protein
MPNLKSIRGVEVFAAGTWNGDTYTIEDLDEMVKAFAETSETCRPPLKLGHTEDQKLLQDDGLPAAGWIGNLYRLGEKLVADFVDIPEKIFQLIENKAYRNVSSEIYWNIEMGDKAYNRMLSAVALLGCDMPAVSNLRDIMAMYKRKFKTLGAEKCYQLVGDTFTIKSQDDLDQGGPNDMDKEKLEAQLKEYEAKLAAKEAEVTVKDVESKATAAKLKEYEAQIEADKVALAEFQKEKAAASLDLAVEDVLKTEGACAGMKPYLKELLGDEKKSYKFKPADKDLELSKSDLVKELIKLTYSASKLNKDETTIDGEKIAQAKALKDEIAAYEKEHKVSYAVAYKAVMKSKGK